MKVSEHLLNVWNFLITKEGMVLVYRLKSISVSTKFYTDYGKEGSYSLQNETVFAYDDKNREIFLAAGNDDHTSGELSFQIPPGLKYLKSNRLKISV
jgi:hypothetical protein